MLNLAPQDGEVYYLPAFVPPGECDEFMATLLRELDWQEEEIVIAGRTVKVPRLTCWYGDAGAFYRYSGVSHRPKPWTKSLRILKARIEQACERPFNSVLGNLSQDGQDSMGWHADQERELGPNPFIASFSLGEQRLFKLQHKKSRASLDLNLESGSLLLMGGSLQHHWRHCLPKTRAPKTQRINLTFRTVLPPSNKGESDGKSHSV